MVNMKPAGPTNRDRVPCSGRALPLESVHVVSQQLDWFINTPKKSHQECTKDIQELQYDMIL